MVLNRCTEVEIGTLMKDFKKSEKKSNWWNTQKSKIQYKSVLFVTPTPGDVLAKELQKREEELNKNNDERIKIVEKGGLKIKDILAPNIFFKNSNCNNCPLCSKSKFVETHTDEIKSHTVQIV